jgi:hypothetical protein
MSQQTTARPARGTQVHAWQRDRATTHRWRAVAILSLVSMKSAILPQPLMEYGSLSIKYLGSETSQRIFAASKKGKAAPIHR